MPGRGADCRVQSCGRGQDLEPSCGLSIPLSCRAFISLFSCSLNSVHQRADLSIWPCRTEGHEAGASWRTKNSESCPGTGMLGRFHSLLLGAPKPSWFAGVADDRVVALRRLQALYCQVSSMLLAVTLGWVAQPFCGSPCLAAQQSAASAAT